MALDLDINSDLFNLEMRDRFTFALGACCRLPHRFAAIAEAAARSAAFSILRAPTPTM
jgi:hypothetical protein